MRASFTVSCSSSLATVKRVESHQHEFLDSEASNSGPDILRTFELLQKSGLYSLNPEQRLFSNGPASPMIVVIKNKSLPSECQPTEGWVKLWSRELSSPWRTPYTEQV